jgi:hypothetical protein
VAQGVVEGAFHRLIGVGSGWESMSPFFIDAKWVWFRG